MKKSINKMILVLIFIFGVVSIASADSQNMISILSGKRLLCSVVKKDQRFSGGVNETTWSFWPCRDQADPENLGEFTICSESYNAQSATEENPGGKKFHKCRDSYIGSTDKIGLYCNGSGFIFNDEFSKAKLVGYSNILMKCNSL